MADSHPIISVDSTPRGWLLLCAGWGAFFVLWTLFLLGWGQGETSLQVAATSGVITTATAALLGVLVWRLTSVLGWPETLRLSFFLWHLLAAILFSAAWTSTAPVIATLMEGGRLSDIRWDVQNLVWRMFMGIWLYFIVVGVSYAVRINRHLQQQRELAMRAEALAARANLQAMRSQLRPHFLFNALHSVGSLIETDPETASDAMERLGDMLRYTIRERDEDRVRMSEEWSFVSDYVALQAMRFGDRIRVEAHMDAACGARSVPPFVLQPLVENAFIHGPGSQPGDGVISISVTCNAGQLEMEVRDDGPGPEGQEGGSGLANLRHRLSAIYGSNAMVSLTRTAPRGALARVLLLASADGEGGSTQ